MARGQMSKIRQKTAAGEGNLADMTPKQLKEAAATMRKSTPNALRRKNPLMKEMTDADIMATIEHMEALANDPELRKQAQEQRSTSNQAEMRELNKLRNKKPEDMTPEELSKLMRAQREILNSNPDAFWKMMANNPTYASMPKEEIAKTINQMADMSPEELHQYFGMQKSIGPMVTFMQKAEVATRGTARYIVITVVVLFVYWLIRKLIFRV